MKTLALAFLGALALSSATQAAEVKVLTAGAMQNVVLALVPGFEAQTGHKISIVSDTVGGLTNRIQSGEAFDVAVMTPAALDDLAMKGKLDAGSRANLARVGVGVMVKEGASVPDIATVDSLRRALLAAPSVSYTDPAAGGSSGIYFNGLIERMGIAQEVRAKAKLKQGGAVADYIESGVAALGVQQISEIVGHAGIVFVGPLPAEIQNYTVYGAAAATAARNADGAQAFIRALSATQAGETYRAKGMEPVR